MDRQTHTLETVTAALHTFLADSDQLTQKSWRLGSGVSSSTVVRLLGPGHFTNILCDFAAQHAPEERTYRWGLCPMRQRHQPEDYFVGTKGQWLAGSCPKCEQKAVRRQAWLEQLPTFEQEHPHLVDYLFDKADAQSRGELVSFVCAECGSGPMRWSPRAAGVPTCSWCKVAQGHEPGAAVPRDGGGEHVRFEHDLADALNSLGYSATTTMGVLVPKGSYFTPVIKSDILLLDARIAIEVDHVGGYRVANTHDTPEGTMDDKLRDELLDSVGWRTLRIRRPDQAADGSWPWRVETTSSAPKKVAQLIDDELRRASMCADES